METREKRIALYDSILAIKSKETRRALGDLCNLNRLKAGICRLTTYEPVMPVDNVRNSGCFDRRYHQANRMNVAMWFQPEEVRRSVWPASRHAALDAIDP